MFYIHKRRCSDAEDVVKCIIYFIIRSDITVARFFLRVTDIRLGLRFSTAATSIRDDTAVRTDCIKYFVTCSENLSQNLLGNAWSSWECGASKAAPLFEVAQPSPYGWEHNSCTDHAVYADLDFLADIVLTNALPGDFARVGVVQRDADRLFPDPEHGNALQSVPIVIELELHVVYVNRSACDNALLQNSQFTFA